MPNHPEEGLVRLTAEQRRDLALLRQIRPYLRRCLELNHDIGNPLAGIMGYAELLQAEADRLSDDARQSLSIIIECAERINRALEVLGEEKLVLAAQIDLSELSREFLSCSEPLNELVGLAKNPLGGQRRDE